MARPGYRVFWPRSRRSRELELVTKLEALADTWHKSARIARTTAARTTAAVLEDEARAGAYLHASSLAAQILGVDPDADQRKGTK